MPPKNKGDKGNAGACEKDCSAKMDILLSKFEDMDKRMEHIENQIGNIEKNTEGIKAIERDIAEIKEDTRLQKVTLTEHTEALDFLSKDMEKVQKDTKEIREKAKGNESHMRQLENTCKRLDTERRRMQEDIRKSEDYSKRDCLLFDGLAEAKDENCKTKILNLIKTNLEIEKDIMIQRCHRLGQPQNERTRPIIVKFVIFEDIQDILKNAYKLKGTKLYVRNFYSDATTNRRQALTPLFLHMKHKKNMKCSLINDSIVVEKEKITLESAKSWITVNQQ